jgi:hypothetical protein
MPPDQLRQFLPYLIGLPLLFLIVVYRLRRMSTSRPLRLEWLWITPAIFVALTAAAMANAPPTGLDMLWLACALGLGGVLGWYRGKSMKVDLDPETHALSARGSPAAMIFLVALILMRSVLRGVSMSLGGAWGFSPTLVTDVFLVFAIGLLSVQRIEMALRARRLLADARAAKAALAV